ncbi:Hypothetical protein SRAE_2000234400 [Strongyloides ratti]|uniref:Hsr-9 Tudor domain-containing protein n=1 Tax=Strongyloides ratti TaxID=34506 RepID=A0A090LHS8_STRRB|nr:Hypothetical protein SRAE_2000234400 [Strongyloides ratti]CEF67683.1 Hypothetical protein SRAE_2000234400 [Strongyloides ratti]
MSNSDSETVVTQENGPVGSTTENVPPVVEGTKDDSNVEIKEIIDDVQTSSADVKVSSINSEVMDDSVKVASHDGASDDSSNRKIEDVPNDVVDTSSNDKVMDTEPSEVVAESVKEDVKMEDKDAISVPEEANKEPVLENDSEENQSEKKVEETREKKDDGKNVVMEGTDDNCEVETPKSTKSKVEDESMDLPLDDSNAKNDDVNQDLKITPKTRLRNTTVSDSSESKDVKEETAVGKRGRRSKLTKTTSDSDQINDTPEKTPSTAKRGRRVSKVQSKTGERKVVEESEVEAEPMEVDEDIEVKTPKRGKRVTQKITPVVESKKRGTKRRINEEPQKETKKAKSDEDAYNIDNLDEHPDLGDSFKLERQSNGGAKFVATSSYKKGRFSEIEKAAKERNADSFKEEDEGTIEPKGKKSISLLTLNDKKLVSQIDGDVEKKVLKTPKTKSIVRTPKSNSKSSKTTPKNIVKTPAKITSTSAKNLDVCDFILPEMTEDSQFDADTKFDIGDVNQYARVYASYCGICYAAVTTGKSTVSSFEVQFKDDKVMKYIARGGIYRLQELMTGLEVEFMDGENTFEGVIKSVPDSTKASDFYKANFIVEKKDDDGKTSEVVVNWAKIILDKSVLKNLKNVEAEVKSIGKTPKRKNQL